ncbi:MAG: helix-hairpin-helix domain-containing protein [PVC group bacterium]
MRTIIACSMIALLALAISAPLLAEVDVNTATASQLTAIKGIGPKTAEKIIQYRDENGPFSSINDVVRVKGVGPKTLEKMIDSGLVCNPPAGAAVPAAPAAPATEE